MIELEHVTKVYKMGQTKIRALDDINFIVQAGEIVAVMGPSGSGKSTLMAILGCLDVPSEGTYRLEGETVEKLSDNQLAQVRSRKIGFVFQQFNLLPRTSALENVMLPLLYDGVHGKARNEKAKNALEIVGLSDRMHHRPNQLSGGEQQRVAIARALVNEPKILLADEPTGNLDTKTGDEIISLFQKLHEERGQTVVYVTHDAFIARHTQRIIRLVDGKIISDDPIEHPLAAGTPRPEEALMEQIS